MLLCAFVLALALYQSSSGADTRGDTTKREMAGFTAITKIARGTSGQATIVHGDGAAPDRWWTIYGPNGYAGYLDGPGSPTNGFNVEAGGMITVPNDSVNGAYQGYYIASSGI